MQGNPSVTDNSTSQTPQNPLSNPAGQSKAATVPTSKSKTAPGYTVKPGTEGFYHLEVEQYSYKQQPPPAPPLKTSTPHVAKYTPADFRRFLEDQNRLGYHLNEIKHDPDTDQTALIYKQIEEAKQNKKRVSK